MIRSSRFTRFDTLSFAGISALLIVILLTPVPQLQARSRTPGPASSATDLAATASDPLYTTYCADIARSQFVPDQGYHFRYYDANQPVAFTTNEAGDWGIIIKVNGDLISSIDDYHSAPIIHESWPDYVRWSAEPTRDLSLSSQFHVHTSSMAIWDVVLTNTGPSAQTITLVPYISDELLLLPDSHGKSIEFLHEHPADGWTIGKQIPHPFQRYNRFEIFPTADTMSVFSSLVNEPIQLPEWISPEDKPVFPVYGRIQREDGSRIDPSQVSAQAIAFLEHDPKSLISLDSPMRRSTWKPWVERGYFALEMAELEWSNRIYSAETGWSDHDSNDVRVIVSVPDEGLAAQLEMTRAVPLVPRSERHDLTLTNDLPNAPRNLTVHADSFGLHLEWNGNSRQIFRVYWNHMKCRMTAQEAASRDRRKDSYLIAGARSVRQFKFLGQTDKTSFSLDLRPRVEAPDGSGRVKVAYNPDNDPFIRRFIVTTTTTDKYPGPASETVIYSPVPALAQQLSVENAVLEPDALMATGTALQHSITLAPGQSDTVRIVRHVAADEFEFTRNHALLTNLQGRTLEHLAEPHRKRFDNLPPVEMFGWESELLFRSALNMVYQCMLPAEGQLTHPYYVFSREPTWGWGHGGQVFHESLSMTTLVHLDPVLAMESQRAYLDVQHENGYIPYRSGPYLCETIPTNGELTASAPWYAWTNWQIYLITSDRAFLEEMYGSSVRFHEYITKNRDKDEDGLAEWGGHGILESVRDASVVIWNEVAGPSELECLDLNCLLVNEARALAEMAFELGLSEEGDRYKEQADDRGELIESTFWDEETGFFYHVDAGDHDFSVNQPDDLKRKEIIGFLPLWVGIGSNEQVERVISEHLLNPDSFWREFGVPSLAADDASYNPRGYWNGPVWVQWNELIFRLLLNHGRSEQAWELIAKLEGGITATLSNDHNLWEFYSPDQPWGGWHHNYIWASTIAGMMMHAYLLTE